MKSLFRSIEVKKRETHLKECLSSQLRATVQDVVNEHECDGTLKTNETTNSLCTVIEAIFIHGLKETLADKLSLVISNPDMVPQPDFWSLVLVFSHRDVIEQIQKLSQITTDIGKCRAWIRLSLNEYLMASYVNAISSQNMALAPYYKKTAYLRDSFSLSLLKSAIHDLSSVTFDLPTNSCLLNYWTNPPLLMAGLWTPAIKPGPVPEGMDIASNIPSSQDTKIPEPPPMPTLEHVLYDEEEALKIILGTPIQDSMESIFVKQVGLTDASVESKELSSDSDNVEPPPKAHPEIISEKSQTEVISPEPPKLESPESYDTLLKGYNPTSPPPKTDEKYQDLMERFKSKIDGDSDSSNKGSIDDATEDFLNDFEIVPATHKDHFNLPEFRTMVSHLGKLMHESGLLSQNFVCINCDQLIGLNFGPARVCALTGSYYCDRCFNEKEQVIPARILHNWDFSKHIISGKAASFLEDIQNHPLLDVRLINPLLYLVVQEMAELQKLRMRLNLLRMYLSTCRDPVIEALKKQLWPREYLYEHVHLYSFADLLEIPSNSLTNLLKDVVNFCEQHVFRCSLCSLKGFICEVCNKKEIIYPFNLDSTFRCAKCSLVIHIECRKEIEECPKCLRIKKRQSKS